MINYHDLRAKLEETIAMYEQAIAEYDAFINENGLQAAFNAYCERAARGIESSKMTLDEAEDTGGNYDEADIENEIEQERLDREMAAKKEEAKKKVRESEEQDSDKRKIHKEYQEYSVYRRIADLAIDVRAYSKVMGIDQIHVDLADPEYLAIESKDHKSIVFQYDELTRREKEGLASHDDIDYVGLMKTEFLDLETGHISGDEKYRSWEKGILISLAYALKRTSYNGLSRQSQDLFAPLKKLLDYEAVSRASYMLFSAVHIAEIDKLLSERDDMFIKDVIAEVENREYDDIFEALKEGDSQKLKGAYIRLDEAAGRLKIMAELYPEALDITELTPGESDPQYKFSDLSEIQAYARARIKELDQTSLDKKQKKSR